MIEPNLPGLSVGKQCALLSISRSSFYYEPKGESEMNLDLMRLIDKQFLETPFYGVRQMTWHLRNDGQLVNEKRIRRLMRLMGLMPIYQKPNTRYPATHACMCERGQGRKGPQNLPLLAAWPAGGSAQSSLVCRHHIPTDETRLPLSGGHHGLAHAQGAGLAYLQHVGSGLLRRSVERSDPKVRAARDHEHPLS